MARKQRVHPLAAAATLVPLAIGLGTPAPPKPAKVPSTIATSGGPVGTACTLPFDAIKREHNIDSFCEADGTSTTDKQARQNEAKNNFCAKGKPVNLNFGDFAQLQREAEAQVTFGSDAQLPDDRGPLRNIASIGQRSVGEGSLVRLVAFVLDAHYSNTSKGESVNCKRSGNENNDIHIVLGQNPVPLGQQPTEAEECASLTAEMSPHFRPDVWVPGNLTSNNQKKFRFTGQLFFDAAHKPCKGSTGPNPKRVALWEIHPVYSVEVCMDRSNSCTISDDNDWIVLSDLVAGSENENETRIFPNEINLDHLLSSSSF